MTAYKLKTSFTKNSISIISQPPCQNCGNCLHSIVYFRAFLGNYDSHSRDHRLDLYFLYVSRGLAVSTSLEGI